MFGVAQRKASQLHSVGRRQHLREPWVTGREQIATRSEGRLPTRGSGKAPPPALVSSLITRPLSSMSCAVFV